jgi:hypothetical protein
MTVVHHKPEVDQLTYQNEIVPKIKEKLRDSETMNRLRNLILRYKKADFRVGKSVDEVKLIILSFLSTLQEW